MPSKITGHIKKGSSLWLRLFRLTDHALAPRRLHIDIAHECNLDCFMCPRYLMKTKKKNLSSEEFEYILGQFPKVKDVTLQGCGETMVNPDFFEMLNLGGSKNINFTITTNGTMLSEKNIKKLNNVSNVIVSIDSPSPETYKAIRGWDIEVMANNLKKLKRLKKNVRLSIQSIIMEETVGDLPKLVDFARDVKAEEVTFLHLETFRKELWKKHAYMFKEDVVKNLQKAKELAKKNKIKLVVPPLEPKMRRCTEPWVSPRIAVNGDIYPCCYIYVSSAPKWEEWYQGARFDVPQFQYNMGNIFEDSLDEIWDGDNYRLLRKTIRGSEKRTEMSAAELSEMRKKVNLKEKFSYCKVCLYRWGCAC